MTRALGFGGETAHTLSQIQPYVNVLDHLPISDLGTAHGLGMTASYYDDSTRGYSCSGCTQWWSTLQANPSYIAKTCGGTIITVSGSGTDEFGDITQSGWQSLWNGYISSDPQFSSGGNTFDYVFADDAGSPAFRSGGDASWLPGCSDTDATYTTDLGTMLQSAPAPVIANSVFESSTTGTTWHNVLANSNVTQAMADSDCYVGGNGMYGKTSDFAITQAFNSYGYSVDSWTQRENDELYLATQGKAFWCLPGANGSASSETSLRIYAYASLMLTYSSNVGYFTAYWQPNSSTELAVYPETGFVPTSPKMNPPSIAGLRQGGIYQRVYNTCYLNGVNLGTCSVKVNPTTSTQVSAWSSSLHHTLSLSGGGVLEGGTASATGPAPQATMPAGTAQIGLP